MDKPVDGAEALAREVLAKEYDAAGFPRIGAAINRGMAQQLGVGMCIRAMLAHSAALVAENERQAADIEFLLSRSGHAGSCSFGGKRWTGMSSNALVAKAFGHDDPAMPSDSSDLAACYRAVMRLPAHRRTPAVFDHLDKAEAHVEARYQGSIADARAAAEWPGRDALGPRP